MVPNSEHIEVALEQLFSTALMMYYFDMTITRSTASSWEPERARKGPKGPDEASICDKGSSEDVHNYVYAKCSFLKLHILSQNSKI